MYTIVNHIQYRYITRTPHERHGIQKKRQFDRFVNSKTWLTAKETRVNSPIPEEINCDILPHVLWNHLYPILSRVWHQKRVSNHPPIRCLFKNIFWPTKININTPIGNIIILDKSLLILWDKSYAALPLQWHHMSAMASGITDHAAFFRGISWQTTQKFTVITGMRHEYHGIPNQWQFDWWFHSLTG